MMITHFLLIFYNFLKSPIVCCTGATTLTGSSVAQTSSVGSFVAHRQVHSRQGHHRQQNIR